MESDSEGSLRDFIDDGDIDDTESTESSDKSSSDESDVQVITDGGKKKSKSTSRSTRSTRSKGLVEGECNMFIFTARPTHMSCLMQSGDVSGGRVMHMLLIAKCTDI